eukprot:TRINITY_DN9013_c0_g1_i4.p1 TRINITY_DN9013_c0_g1~~TRINITY_DN9013_c0_g1_i4.p1  ORF type:complete len:597 (-),score=156.18 TRINITY_DN9013_c0_g1_i4:655-2445(-)
MTSLRRSSREADSSVSLRISRGAPNTSEDDAISDLSASDDGSPYDRSYLHPDQPERRGADTSELVRHREPVFGIAADGSEIRCPICTTVISIVNSRFCWSCGSKLGSTDYVSLIRPFKDDARPGSAPATPKSFAEPPMPKFQRDVASARVFAKSKSDLGANGGPVGVGTTTAELSAYLATLNIKRKTSLDLTVARSGSRAASPSGSAASSPSTASAVRIGPSRLIDDGSVVIRDEKDLPQIPSSNVKEAIYNAQEAYFSEADRYKIYDILLEHLLTLTESTYGYAGYVKFKDGKQRVKVRVVMSRTPDGVKSTEESHWLITKPDHICSVVLQSRQVVISNSPDDEDFPMKTVVVPNVRDCPPFRSCMAVPIFTSARETMLAVMVVFNRPFGYGVHHIVTIQPYIKTCANLLESHVNHNLVKAHNRESGFKKKGVSKKGWDADAASTVDASDIPSPEMLGRRRFTDPVATFNALTTAAERRSSSDLGAPPMGSISAADAPPAFTIRRVRKNGILSVSPALRESVPDLGRRFSESVVDPRPLTMSAPAVGLGPERRDSIDMPPTTGVIGLSERSMPPCFAVATSRHVLTSQRANMRRW